MKSFAIVFVGLVAVAQARPQRIRRDVDEVKFGGEDTEQTAAIGETGEEEEDSDIRNKHHRPYGGQTYYSNSAYNRPSYGGSYNRPSYGGSYNNPSYGGTYQNSQYGYQSSPYYQNNFGSGYGTSGYNSNGAGYNGNSGGYSSNHGTGSTYGGSNTGYSNTGYGQSSYGTGHGSGNGYGSNLGGYYSNYGSGAGLGSSYGRR